MNKNQYFQSEEQAYECALLGLKKYPYLSELINLDLLEKAWYRKLSKDGLDKYFNPDFPYTVFTLSALAGRIEIHNGDFMYYDDLLGKVENIIRKLSDCKGIESFSGKLRNPEGLQFHSSCSELFLTEHYFDKGAAVAFEIPFAIIDTNDKVHNRDIDILITNQDNSKLIEVYNPIDDMEEGFISFSTNEFLHAMRNKIEKKFMPQEAASYTGLDFDVIFAVNFELCSTLTTTLSAFVPSNLQYLNEDLRQIKESSKIIKNILLFRHDSNNPLNPVALYYGN